MSKMSPGYPLGLAEDRMTLDKAWDEAEAALPDGWSLGMLWGTTASERWGAMACPWPPKPNDSHEFGGGDTPIAALRQLAGRLAERDQKTGALTLDQLRARSPMFKAPS